MSAPTKTSYQVKLRSPVKSLCYKEVNAQFMQKMTTNLQTCPLTSESLQKTKKYVNVLPRKKIGTQPGNMSLPLLFNFAVSLLGSKDDSLDIKAHLIRLRLICSVSMQQCDTVHVDLHKIPLDPRKYRMETNAEQGTSVTSERKMKKHM